jgi:hypothetical protein
MTSQKTLEQLKQEIQYLLRISALQKEVDNAIYQRLKKYSKGNDLHICLDTFEVKESW